MIERLEKECEELRGRIEAMEKRVPLKSSQDADKIVHHERHELRVRLYGLANNRSQQALIVLCEYLNTQQEIYPGTNLRLVYEAIQSH